MLLLLVLALLDFGSSYTTENICYGSSYDVPIYYTPPLLSIPIYYKPRNGERILAVTQEGKSKEKRFLVRFGSIKIQDLTEQDDKAMVIFGQSNSVRLEIQDCQEPTTKKYGDLFSWKIQNGAEYLEFSQVASSGVAQKPQVLWNRTDASTSRGTVKRGYFELDNIKQKDSGYYKFMGGEGQLLRWKRLKVHEYFRSFEHTEGDYFTMDFPVNLSFLRVQFAPRGTTSASKYMRRRMEIDDYFIAISDVKLEDAGNYTFIDAEGFLAVHVDLQVNAAQLPTWVYIVALVVIVLCIIFCCCCVKKCCCKKTSDKRTSPVNEAAAPPVFYHDNTSQPTHPVNPLLDPSSSNKRSRPVRDAAAPPEFYHDNTSQPTHPVIPLLNAPSSTQVTVPEGPGPMYLPVISTSSDSDPKFEFKGMGFPSAPPLSSDTSIQSVYTSDKLNFL